MTDRKPLYISQKNFLRIVRKLIKEKGADYIYKRPPFSSQCMYTYKNEPSYIVGHLIQELDPTFEFGPYNTVSIDELINKKLVSAHSTTKEALIVLQRRQDKGVPWGEAFKDAKKWLTYK